MENHKTGFYILLPLADCWAFLVSEVERKTQTLLVFCIWLGHVCARHRPPPALTTVLGAGGLSAERPRCGQEAGPPRGRGRCGAGPGDTGEGRGLPGGARRQQNPAPPALLAASPIFSAIFISNIETHSARTLSALKIIIFFPEIRNVGLMCRLDSSL